MRNYQVLRSGQVVVAGGRNKTGRALLRLDRRIWVSWKNFWAPYTSDQQLAAQKLAAAIVARRPGKARKKGNV